MIRSIAAVTLAALCATAHALPTQAAESGFLTGEYFRGGSPSLRTAYVIGVLDGFAYAHDLGAPASRVSKLQTCIGAMHADAKQLAGVVDHYLDAHRDTWKDKMQPIVWNAMRETCTAHGLSIEP